MVLGVYVASRWTPSSPPPQGVSETLPIAERQFEMGSSVGEPDEAPVHLVTVSAFRIDRTEVTVSDYAACVRSGACAAAHNDFRQCNAGRTGANDHPINCVNFQMADAYCRWKGKRLPTEAEWELAASGGDGRAYPWGNEPDVPRACLARRTRAQESCPVGSFPRDASPLGVMDMAGNVSEWIGEAYCSYSRDSECETGSHVVRGGSWDTTSIRFARTSYRDWVPDNRYGYNLGFRCAGKF